MPRFFTNIAYKYAPITIYIKLSKVLAHGKHTITETLKMKSQQEELNMR